MSPLVSSLIPSSSTPLHHQFPGILLHALLQILGRDLLLNPRQFSIFIHHIDHHLHGQGFAQFGQEQAVFISIWPLKIRPLPEPPLHLLPQGFGEHVNGSLFSPLSPQNQGSCLWVVIGYFQLEELADLHSVEEKELQHHQVPEADPLSKLAVQVLVFPVQGPEQGIHFLF